MPAGTNATKLTDLFDPEVVADFIDQKLVDAIRLSPLATVDSTLVGRPGDELTMPYYSAYVGDAEDVAEGGDIPIAKITEGTKKVKVSKIGRAVEFTDEALISGAGNIAEEASRQVLTAINSKVEADLISNLAANATLVFTHTSGDLDDDIADALTLFGEDIDGDKVLLISPQMYATLRKTQSWIPNTEIGAEALIRGTVGMVHGCQIVTSNRMYDYEYTVTSDSSMSSSKTYYEKVVNSYVETEDESFQTGKTYYEKSATKKNKAYVIKPGALRIVMKRNTLVEFDRDILAETNFIKASKLFAPYVYDTSKVVKLNLD